MPQPKSGKSKPTAKAATSNNVAGESVDPANQSEAPSADAASKSRTERRQEKFAQRREDRKKAPAKQKRDRLVTRVVLGAIAVVLIGALAYEVINYISTREERQMPDNVATYAYAGGDHTYDTVDYPESPPVGGTHDPAWQTCDFYDAPIRNENAVHSLEHGAVWITYRPDLSDEEKERLRDIRGGDRYVLVSEYADQESPIVATAWNNQLEIDSAEDVELKQFINYFRQGPQTQEPGATCDGGVTSTLG
ncbi:MAG: DUF3105 domain-containing protein [Thermomicrobiales bacterium]|nr:DUF3105 domain-containing protein [Thermomicrobiales bacterium]